MRSRTLALSAEEEEELRILCDSGELNSVADHYKVSYREAYFIYKGKCCPSYEVDDSSLSRWF